MKSKKTNTLTSLLIRFSPVVILGLLFAFPRVGRFVFTNFYYVLGAMCLYIVSCFVRDGLNLRVSTGKSFWSVYYRSAPKDASFLQTIRVAVINSCIAFGVGLFTGSVPYSFFVAPMIARYHTTDLLINHVAYVLWGALLVTFLIVAGFETLRYLGKRAWLYGLSFFGIFMLGFCFFALLWPCHSASCGRDQWTIWKDFLENPWETYKVFAVMGAGLGIGPLVGGIIASLRKEK